MQIRQIGTGILAVLALALFAPGAQAQFGYLNSPVIGGGPLILMGAGRNQMVYLNGRTAIPLPDPYLTPQYLGPQDIPRTSDEIDARIEKDGKLLIRWQGEPRAVHRISFALLDKNRKVLKETTITRLPAETRFTLTNKTTYYRVTIEYINGTVTSVVSMV